MFERIKTTKAKNKAMVTITVVDLPDQVKADLKDVAAMARKSLVPPAAAAVDFFRTQLLATFGKKEEDAPKPTERSWRNPALYFNPEYLLLHMHHKSPAISMNDIRSEDLEGTFLQHYRAGIAELMGYEPLGEKANKLVSFLETLAFIYIPSCGDLKELSDPSSIEAATRVIVSRLTPTLKSMKDYVLGLDVERIRATHGDKSANIFAEVMTGLAPTNHVQGANSSLALKQVLFHSTITGGGRSKRQNDGSGPPAKGNLQRGQCRKCLQMVGVGKFTEHNKVCPKRKK